VDGIEQKFADRVIPVDAAVDQRCGELAADRTCPVIDTLIAATAVVHDLTLVTRNTDDVAGINIKTINPWI
jgi:predicted nucleic acid-binding protein